MSIAVAFFCSTTARLYVYDTTSAYPKLRTKIFAFFPKKATKLSLSK